MKLASRMKDIPPYIFAALAERIREKEAQGIRVLNLGVGRPDLTPPSWITEVMIEASLVPKHHRYPSYLGSPELRGAWASYYEARFGVTLDPKKEVLPLIGSKEGIAHIALALVDVGDVVLVPDPGHPTYRMGTIMAGGTPVTYPLDKENNFLPDLDAIPRELLDRAVAMWLNYPNNPTGAIASLDFYAEVAALAKKHNFAVLSDNPYADITYDRYRAPSFLEVPGAKEVGIEINSLSKIYNMAGWRIGVAVGNPTLINALMRVKSNIDTGIFYPLQAGAVAALTGDQSWIAERNAIYQKRRDVGVAGLRAAGFTVESPAGSLFLWPQVPAGVNTVELANHLLDNAAVWMVPGEAYGPSGKQFMRLALCSPLEVLEHALKRVREVM